jgi:DnaJ like chaperone protein
MKGWSKAVGTGLGYFVGGPIGAVLGYMAGNKLAPKLQADEGHLLIANFLGFASLFLKLDRPPSAEECQETVRFTSKLFRFDAEDEDLAGKLLHRLLQVQLDLVAMAKTFNNNSDTPMRLRLLEILATLSLLIHGPLHGSQLALLDRIAEVLALSPLQSQVITSRYQTQSPQLDTACCYALLDLYPEASAEEIKAGYRRLAMKYHPDRFAHLDQAIQQLHAHRMPLINAAYETIRADKGI